MKILSHQFKVPDFFGDSNWHTINLESSATLSRINPVHTVEANLNSQWGLASESDIITAAGSNYTVLRSESNYNIASQNATMYVNFLPSYPGGMEFMVMNRAEGGYDYPIITLNDGTTLYSNSSNTRVFSTFKVDAPGEHIMTVVFRKDGSGNTDLDRAYLAVPIDVAIL